MAKRTCSHPDGCPLPRHTADGLCSAHGSRLKRKGDIGPAAVKSHRKKADTKPWVEGGVGYIPLTQGQTAVIDADMVPAVAAWIWSARRSRKTWYAMANDHTAPRPNGSLRGLILHRFIMGLDYGDPREVDHIDHDGLNNRRSNLRIADDSQNMANRTPVTGSSSRYKGVHWDKRCSKWRAQFALDGRQVHLGLFVDEDAAARAYDAAAVEAHGGFACLNFPDARPEALGL